VQDAGLAAHLHASLKRSISRIFMDPARSAQAPGLEAVRHAVLTGALPSALRHMDRAWRCQPENAAVIAPLYGRLLLLESSDDGAALNLLRRPADPSPDAEAGALRALALLRLQRPEEARAEIEAALANFCVTPGGLLSHAAGWVLRHPALAAPGWIGRGARLEFVGELRAADASGVLDVRLEGHAAFAQLLRPVPAGDAFSFTFKLPRPQAGAVAEVASRGLALLGSGARFPMNFGLDGRIRCTGRLLGGWATLGWCPARSLKLKLQDDNARSETRTRPWTRAGPQGSFEVDLRRVRLRGSRIHVSAQLPDGRWQPLPDSPLLLDSAVRPTRGRWQRARVRKGRSGRLRSRPAVERAPATDVIVPVYGGGDATLGCLESVLATADHDTAVVVVDDGTDDPELVAALDRYAGDGRITLLRNPSNLGFAASVNRGLGLHPTHDAVVLNSDTRVYADWLGRLREAAYSDRAVGTVTPWSNSGSILSYPSPGGSALDPAGAAALHALAASTHAEIRADIPVGVGFCLFLRRDCLRDVGDLDAGLFGDGYGEETDFCLRARSRGWSHRLAADVFVYHAGGLSFGSRREALLERSGRLVNLRHPGYDRFIASYLKPDPLQALRRRLDERRLAAVGGRAASTGRPAVAGRFVLVVTLALTGGVERFVAERCRTLRAQGLSPLLLRPAAAGDKGRCELSSEEIELPNLRYDLPAELPPLDALLRALPIESIDIQHFLHLDSRLIEAILSLPVPYRVYVHDYTWICPRVTLIDGTGRYCGEPALEVCEACVRREGSELGESISVAALRERSARWLRGASRVVAPSWDTAARIERRFDGLAVAVEAHGPTPATASAHGPVAASVDTPEPAPAPVERPRPAERVTRVALIGALGEHKGYRVLLDCARDAKARSLPLEFVVIGYTEDDEALLETGHVFVTGRYADGEPPHLLRREDPDLIWLPSVWPETWCYTLDYALAGGLPVAAFDLGAIAERLRGAGRGDLMPLDLPPPRINDRLLRLNAAPPLASLTASRSDNSALVAAADVDIMAARQTTELSMSNSSDVKPPEVVPPLGQDEGLAASLQVLPLMAGLYLFSVKPSNAAPPVSGGRLRLPAMHVGVGPGVPPDQVEFMAGPMTHGAWLIAPADLLVVKVNGTGAALMLNSVRAPDGATLSIKVERLNGRVETASSPAPASATAIATAQAAAEPSVATFTGGDRELPLAVHIAAHIRSRGDMNFTAVPWAGRVAPGLWIESFAVRPLERFEAKDLEYKALTGSGFETPWLSDGTACGTQGMGVPLVGFALRFKGSAASGYDCEYSGYFQSGVTVGPLRNGSPCRSTVANDPLEGIQVRLVQRAAASPAAAPPASRSRPAQRHSARGS
jgi:GT2 family glycosyltransferase